MLADPSLFLLSTTMSVFWTRLGLIVMLSRHPGRQAAAGTAELVGVLCTQRGHLLIRENILQAFFHGIAEGDVIILCEIFLLT
jgi:hypothetical protein